MSRINLLCLIFYTRVLLLNTFPFNSVEFLLIFPVDDLDLDVRSFEFCGGLTLTIRKLSRIQKKFNHDFIYCNKDMCGVLSNVKANSNLIITVSLSGFYRKKSIFEMAIGVQRGNFTKSIRGTNRVRKF